MFDAGEQTGMAAARAHFEAGLSLLASQDIDPIAPLQLGCDIKALRGFIDRLEAQCARRVELFDRDRGYAPSGDGSATNWLRHHCNMSGATADRHVKFARQLPDLEKTQQALESGQIGIEHALEIARATEDMGAAAEGELLEAARSKDPVEVRQVAKELRHRADPEGMAGLALAQHRKRRLRLYDLADGMLALEAALPPEGGVALKLCLESLIGIPPKDDERSQQQRHADALLELCRRQLDSGKLPSMGGRKPHLTLVVHAETLAGEAGAPAAQLEGYGAISVETAKRIASGGTLSVLTVDSNGVALNLGRSRRLASEPQRRVLAARRPHCAWPGCTWEARHCEPHHLDEWWRGGGSDVKRMVLLCRARHHPLVFEGGWRVELQRDGSVVPIPPWEQSAAAGT
jgi:hypothetical protein